MADYQSFDGHGVDVAVNRADSLDKQALAYIAERPSCSVLDLGSGAGGQSMRMVEVGAQVTAVDQFDFTQQFAQADSEQLRFIVGDIKELPTLLPEATFDVVMFQRTLHYLTYQDAQKLLGYLSQITTGQMYISVSGLGSLIGDSYPCKESDTEQRYCQLSELGSEMFQIYEPVCLYTQAELTQLLIDTGWQVDSSVVTAFGNIQVICKPTT